MFACLIGSVYGSLSPRSALPTADTVFINGVIHTLDSQSTTIKSGALAISNGTITCVGGEEDCRPSVGNSTKLVDLNGKAMVPGLIDTHVHPLGAGRAMLGCTLRYQQLTQEALRKIIQACLDSQPGETGVLSVSQFDREGFTGINGPGNKDILDALNTTRPIVLYASTGHSAFVNSKALEVANITRETPDPPGGKIRRDVNGNPTGFLDENAALPVQNLGGDEGITDLDSGIAALSQLRKKGITTILDAGRESHDVWTRIKANGGLTTRVFSCFGFLGSVDFPAIISKALEGKKKLDESTLVADAPGQHWRYIKFFVDGILPQVSETAAVLEPYLVDGGNDTWAPGSNFGLPRANQSQIVDLLTRALDAGFGIHLHASGDGAVQEILNAAESMNRTFQPMDIGIAHAELVAVEDRERFAKLGIPVVASYQWAQKATYWANLTEKALGPERMTRVEAHGALNNAGALISYGSDWPIDPLDPFLALSIGVRRQGDPHNRNAHASFGPQFVGRLDQQPALSREAAFRGMTTSAATYLNSSASIGSLEVGKFADLVVLDRDYFDENAVPDEELSRNKVLLTMVGGRSVFADNSTAFIPSDWLAESNKLDDNPVVKGLKPGNILSRAITGRACGSSHSHAHHAH
ncbi:hypothetical protein BS50DRAFT_500362 [Corynespora cassiicola Philippines]|uniref:Amidohydrolase 3 domain-containing protein n=1 Tax=Corynespora cassiicola Philippines TaxID=1448308 RepID=A0A2T2NCA3_CORCC|nr:hypothetical protein BS50DRAFT_500362 [Corynespora cassiicola Philippines]